VNLRSEGQKKTFFRSRFPKGGELRSTLLHPRRFSRGGGGEKKTSITRDPSDGVESRYTSRPLATVEVSGKKKTGYAAD